MLQCKAIWAWFNLLCCSCSLSGLLLSLIACYGIDLLMYLAGVLSRIAGCSSMNWKIPSWKSWLASFLILSSTAGPTVLPGNTWTPLDTGKLGQHCTSLLPFMQGHTRLPYICWSNQFKIHSGGGLPCTLLDSLYGRFRDPPPSYRFVKATLEGLQCSLAEPVTKKKPVTLEVLEAMVDDDEKSGSLSNLHLVTASLLSFAGLLWFDELINLRSYDFIFSQEMLKIKIIHSKTVAMLECYMWCTCMPLDDQRILFRPIQSTKKTKCLWDSGR